MSGFCGKTITKGGGTVPKERTAPPPLRIHIAEDRPPDAYRRKPYRMAVRPRRTAETGRAGFRLRAPRADGPSALLPPRKTRKARPEPTAPGALFFALLYLFAAFSAFGRARSPPSAGTLSRPPISCSSRTARRSGTCRSATASSRPDWTAPRWRRRSPPPWRSWSAPPQ